MTIVGSQDLIFEYSREELEILFLHKWCVDVRLCLESASSESDLLVSKALRGCKPPLIVIEVVFPIDRRPFVLQHW